MGQSTIDSIDDADNILSVKVNALYDQTRDELQADGPSKGWKFTRRRYHGIDDDSYTVTAIAQNSTDITVTATHTLAIGDEVELDEDTGYGGVYDVKAISTTVSFDVTATFAATGTGTARWTSEQYAYRYLIPTTPTVLRVVKAMVGGIELTDWLEEGDYILTNMESDEIDLEIIQQITTTTKFPTHFTRVLVLALAIKLHYNLTQDLKAIDKLAQELDVALPKAIGLDEERKYVQEKSSSWVDAGNINDNIE